MRLTRRALLLAAPLLLAAEPAERPPLLLARDDGLVALTWPAGGAIILPGGTAALRRLALGGGMLALSVPADAGLSLLALCRLGDSGPRLLALEPLAWRGPHGAHFATGWAEAGPRLIALRREAASPRGRMLWRREAWTDYLAWATPRLTDAPVRAPPPGTAQAALATLRHRALGWLATPRAVLTPADLAALDFTSETMARAVGEPDRMHKAA